MASNITHLWAELKRHAATLTLKPIDPLNEAFGWEVIIEYQGGRFSAHTDNPGQALMLAEQNWGRLQEVKTYGPEVDSFDEQAEENAMLDHHRETCIDPHCHVCGILNG